MDAFVRASAKKIGPGGLKCHCCNIFNTHGNHAKRSKKLSRSRRAALKRDLRVELLDSKVL